MINFSLLKKCPSLVDSISQTLNNKFYKICTDNRRYEHPSCFVAIPGQKVNPLDLIEVQLKQGMPVVIYESNQVNLEKVSVLKKKYPLTEFLAVRSSVEFLQEIAHLHIKEWKSLNPSNTVFAISGSNGKTTHKEMLAHILEEVLPGKIVSTEKNNNNHLGVPLTLMNVKPETEVVVLELGSNHPGEIKVLCDIALPNAGLTTNIGATHLEFFGSEKEVFLEEGYLYHAVKDNTNGQGFYLINKDDSYLSTLIPFEGAVTFGTSSEAMAQIHFTENGAEMTIGDEKLIVSNSFVTGKHNKLNLITSAFIAFKLFGDLKEKIQAAAASFRPTKNRSQWIKLNEAEIFLDAYNANPSSMRASLDGFKEFLLDKSVPLDKSCVILGDMNELGDKSAEFHSQTGAYVKSLGFMNVYFVGRYSQDYLKGFPEAHAKENAASFKSEFMAEVLGKYHFHFIKGSRSLQLESLLDIT